MIYGFRHQGGYEIPDWADKLKFYYFVIRVEGRDKAKRRRYYRLITMEKLMIAEQGIDQELIKYVCRYLSGLSPRIGIKMNELMSSEPIQLTLKLKE